LTRSIRPEYEIIDRYFIVLIFVLSIEIHHFLPIDSDDKHEIYQISTSITASRINENKRHPISIVRSNLVVRCESFRPLSNYDIQWSSSLNGTCSSSIDFDRSFLLTRRSFNCQYVDDENPQTSLSATPFERQLLRFDRSLIHSERSSIVFYGSSSIRLWKSLADDFVNTSSKIINRGFGGSTMTQCWQQFKRVILPLEPCLLIIYAGENDIADEQTPASIQIVFRQLIATIRRFYSSLPIVYISIKPSPSRVKQINDMNRTNTLIRDDITSMTNVHYIDVFHSMLNTDGTPRTDLFTTDQLHMNANGYAIWQRIIETYLHTHGLVANGSIIDINVRLFVVTILRMMLYFYD
jgi:lysophospholipase L1-like esterase